MGKRNIRRSAEQWAAIIDRQTRSGLSVKEFCQGNKLGLSTFCKWKRKLQMDGIVDGSQSARAVAAFEPVEIVPDNSVPTHRATRICLTLDEGITLTIDRSIPTA